MYKLLEKIRSPFCDRVFLRKAVVIALPVALQGFCKHGGQSGGHRR